MRLCVELCSTVSVAHDILVTDVVVRVECSRYFFYVVLGSVMLGTSGLELNVGFEIMDMVVIIFDVWLE